ncbi:MAG: hypothetical protein Q8N99_00990 [Nanoarchaeota archaeon]|nr:hypothetical protein [Nanoarchaeota archaeon]
MKRGQSTLISTVLLILIAMVIAVIVINFSYSFINMQTGDSEKSMINYDADIVNIELYNAETSSLVTSGIGIGEPYAYNSELAPTQMIISVKRADNENYLSYAYEDLGPALAYGIRFTFYDDYGDSYTYDTTDAPNIAYQTKTYTIFSDKIGRPDFSDINKVEVSYLYAENKVTKTLDDREW